MSIGSVGSSQSFWQQDQAYWSQAQSEAQSSSLSNALITAMGSVVANQAKGLASIATGEAATRVHAQLVAALQSAIQASQAGSSSSTSNTPAAGAPATGTGTVPLSSATSLLTLGIPKNGTITVSDGTNTTTFASTGSDTVGDLINAINNPNIAANAQVTASLNSSGNLVLTGKNLTDSISVGGLFASTVGFGAQNSSFQPTAPTPTTASSSSSTGSSASSSSSSTAGSSTSSANSSSGSSAAGSTSSPSAVLYNSAVALQTGGTAETLLASSGSFGALVNLLA
jgi:hypothetical protein